MLLCNSSNLEIMELKTYIAADYVPRPVLGVFSFGGGGEWVGRGGRNNLVFKFCVAFPKDLDFSSHRLIYSS